LPGPFHDLRAAEQRGVLGAPYQEGDRLLPDLPGAGDPQDGDRLAVAREAAGRDGRGVLAAQDDPGLLDGLAHGRRVGADGAGPAVGHDRQGAFGTDVQRQSPAPDGPGARDGEVRALGPHPELSERLLHGVGRRPHLARPAVQHEADGAAVPHGDLVAVVEGGAGGGRHHVVRADPQALLREQFAHVVGEGVQGAGLAVDGQLDRLVLGDEGRGAAREERDDQRLGQQGEQAAQRGVRALGPARPAPACGPATRPGVTGVRLAGKHRLGRLRRLLRCPRPR
jgi:hypothetical protein